MKTVRWQVIVSLAFLLKWTCDAAVTNQTSLTVDQQRLQTIEGSMGLDHAPCGDFFKYACAEWHHFEKSLGSENIQVLDYRLRKQLKEIVETFAHITEPKFLGAVYNYYQSCQELEGNDPLDYLQWMNDHENVSWPLVEVRHPVQQDWLELLALTRKYGFNEIFFYEDVRQRQDDPLKLTIELKRPAVIALDVFSTQMYGLKANLNATSTQQFGQFQRDLLQLTLELIKTEEAVDLEFVQNTMSLPSDVEPRLVSLRELEMPWLSRYLKVLLDLTEVDPDMQIYVHSVKYLQRIHEFASKQDNRFLCDYIQIKFLKFLKDKDSISHRGNCLQSTRLLFPLVMQWAYEKNNLQLQWQTSLIRNLFENLKMKFRQTLTANSYDFRNDIIEYLKAKIDNLQLMVGDMSLDDLKHYYEGLTLDANEYYGNRLKVFNWNFKVPHASIGRTLNKSSPELLHLRIYGSDERVEKILILYNLPHLYPRLNTIFLPVTMIQEPYYADGMGDLYAYSSIGFHLAHEIAKAFDQRHLQIDANGITNSQMYAEMQANGKFRRSNERLRKDFEEEHHNTEEVIDDLGGLKLAYDTFAELHGSVLQESVTIHDTAMTMEKVFFLNYAQSFCGPLCGTSTMGYFYYDLCDRVNRPVMHFDKFMQAFKCIEYDHGQPMWR